MPPSMPSTSMSGSASHGTRSGARTGTAPPAIAPAVNWPSAPMFQRFARKQTARPTPISTSGAAFTMSSSIDHIVVTGSTKNT